MKKLNNHNALLYVAILLVAAPAFSADEGGEDWSYPIETTPNPAAKFASDIAFGGIPLLPQDGNTAYIVAAVTKLFVTSDIVNRPLKVTYDRRSTRYLSLLSSIQELETQLKDPDEGLIAKLRAMHADSDFMNKIVQSIDIDAHGENVGGVFKVKPGLKLDDDELSRLTRLNELHAEALETRAELIRLGGEANGIQRAINTDIESGKIKLKFPEGSFDEHKMVTEEGVEHLRATKFKWLRRSGSLLSAISLGDLVADVTNVLVLRKTPGIIPGSGMYRTGEAAVDSFRRLTKGHNSLTPAKKTNEDQ